MLEPENWEVSSKSLVGSRRNIRIFAAELWWPPAPGPMGPLKTLVSRETCSVEQGSCSAPWEKDPVTTQVSLPPDL